MVIYRLTNSLVKRTFSMRKTWSSACMLSLVFMYAKVLKISEIRKYLPLNIVYKQLIFN